MAGDKILIIDGSELFALGIKIVLVENQLTDKNLIEHIKVKKELELNDEVRLAIVGQSLLDHMQFEDILEFIK